MRAIHTQLIPLKISSLQQKHICPDAGYYINLWNDGSWKNPDKNTYYDKICFTYCGMCTAVLIRPFVHLVNTKSTSWSSSSFMQSSKEKHEMNTVFLPNCWQGVFIYLQTENLNCVNLWQKYTLLSVVVILLVSWDFVAIINPVTNSFNPYQFRIYHVHFIFVSR